MAAKKTTKKRQGPIVEIKEIGPNGNSGDLQFSPPLADENPLVSTAEFTDQGPDAFGGGLPPVDGTGTDAPVETPPSNAEEVQLTRSQRNNVKKLYQSVFIVNQILQKAKSDINKAFDGNVEVVVKQFGDEIGEADFAGAQMAIIIK